MFATESLTARTKKSVVRAGDTCKARHWHAVAATPHEDPLSTLTAHFDRWLSADACGMSLKMQNVSVLRDRTSPPWAKMHHLY